MKISSLHLTNFRAFESLDLKLESDVSLLVGLNASGKTAILDALAVALSAWIAGTAQSRLEGRSIAHTDARLVRQETGGLATANPTFPVKVKATGEIAMESLSWERELAYAGGNTTSSGSKQVRDLAQTTETAASKDASVALPLIAYYGTGRLWVEKRDKKPKQQLGSRMQGYAACLEPASNTKLFERWMAWREGDRVQRIAAAIEHGADISTVKTPHLDAVTGAARECLEGVDRFFYSVADEELRVEMTDGRLLPFDRLSDGQRSLVTLAADLAWRAAQLNPQHGSDAARLTHGVVLIDEVELHLHPSWQRKVIGDLRRAFPLVQFVVTTHSPQVISTAKPQWLRLLGGREPIRVDHTDGRDTNSILRDIMGVPPRPEWMEVALQKLEQLLEVEEVVKARTLLEELRKSLGERDRTLVGLEWELHELEGRDAEHS